MTHRAGAEPLYDIFRGFDLIERHGFAGGEFKQSSEGAEFFGLFVHGVFVFFVCANTGGADFPVSSILFYKLYPDWLCMSK